MHRITVDLGGVGALTPTFLKFLVHLHAEAKGFGYAIHLIGVTRHVEGVLQTLGLAQIVTCEVEA